MAYVSVAAEKRTDDNVLSPVSRVEWVAKNVFLLTLPLLKEKVGVELTAVDVDRGTDANRLELIQRVVRKVNHAARVYFRHDAMWNFPNEGYGDVIFSAESPSEARGLLTWISLQETLLRLGCASVVRPPIFRTDAVLAAQQAGQEGTTACPLIREKPSSWLRALHEFSLSPDVCDRATCIVEDVLQGDAFHVRWLGADSATTTRVRREKLPPLLILHNTSCFTPSRELGFKALRWAQQHLVGRVLSVTIHAVTASDVDLANNTQIMTIDQCRAVRGVATLDSGSFAFPDDVVQRTSDVGVALVVQGLAFVRHAQDASVPTGANYAELVQSVGALTRRFFATDSYQQPADGDGCSGNASPDTADLEQTSPAPHTNAKLSLRRDAARLHLPLRQLASLLQFSGVEWARNPGRSMVKHAWHRHSWCADIDRDPSTEPAVLVQRPIKTLFPLEYFAMYREPLRGYASSFSTVRVASTSDDRDGSAPRVFLRVDVSLQDSIQAWRERRVRAKLDSDACVLFLPSSNDGPFPESVSITVQSAGEVDSYQKLKVGITPYMVDQFRQERHTPALEERDPVFTTTLQLPPDASEMLFVVDAEAHVTSLTDNVTKRVVGQSAYHLRRSMENAFAYEHLTGEVNTIMTVGDANEARANGSGGSSEAKTPGQPSGEATGRNEDSPYLPDSTREAKIYYANCTSFLFELSTELLERDIATIRSICEKVLFRDVLCVTVGVVTLNGESMLLGDLLVEDDHFDAFSGERSVISASESAAHNAYPFCLESDPSSRFSCRDRVSFLHALSPKEVQAYWASETPPQLSSGGQSWWTDSFFDWPLASFAEACRTACTALAVKSVTTEEENKRLLLVNAMMKELAELVDEFDGQSSLEPLDLRSSPQYAPAQPLRTSIGAAVLWSDVVDFTTTASSVFPTLRDGMIPPSFPLFPFSAFPRQLFSGHPNQHRKVLSDKPKGDSGKGTLPLDYTHMDWAFMRLSFPSLPNILRSNLEHLPYSVRNVEKAWCEHIQQNQQQQSASHADRMRTERVYGSADCVSEFLSAAAIVKAATLERAAAAAPSTDSSATVISQVAYIEALQRQIGVPVKEFPDTHPVSVVLYFIPHSTTALSDDGVYVASTNEQCDVMIGNRDTYGTDFFEESSPHMPSGVRPWPLPLGAIARAVCAVAVETLTQDSADECSAAIRRGLVNGSETPLTTAGTLPHPVMGHKTLELTRQTRSLPTLYHPAPWLDVMGRPVVQRDEPDPESLMTRDAREAPDVGDSEKNRSHWRRRYINLRYRCVRIPSNRKPYKFFSYGQLSRKDVDTLMAPLGERAPNVATYIACLLQQPAAQQFLDGTLHVYGPPMDPLYVYYHSRAAARLKACLPGVVHFVSSDEGLHAAEQQFLSETLSDGKRLLEDIRKAITSKCGEGSRMPSRFVVAATCRHLTDPKLPPALYVDLLQVDSNEFAHQQTDSPCKSAHQPFALYGTIFQRDTFCTLRYQYSVEENAFVPMK